MIVYPRGIKNQLFFFAVCVKQGGGNWIAEEEGTFQHIVVLPPLLSFPQFSFKYSLCLDLKEVD